MQLSNTGPSLDGFTMEHNEHMICCGMSGVLEPGIVVGTLAASGSGATRTGGLSGGGGGAGGGWDQRATCGCAQYCRWGGAGSEDESCK